MYEREDFESDIESDINRYRCTAYFNKVASLNI